MTISSSKSGPPSGEETQYRMAPGLGVIEWQGRILVYQMAGDAIAWARFLGDQPAEISADLRAAIETDRAKTGAALL